MNKLPSLLLATALTAVLSARAETVIFTDTFSSSTLNGTSTPGGTPSASSTSYDIATTKNGTTCSITADKLQMKLSSGTTAGYIELQAIFTSTPVQLVNVNDSLNVTYTFTNSAGTLLAGGNGSVINVGLYNSGGNLPLAGLLNNAGLGSATTYITGNCQNWQGYVGQINYSGSASAILTRPIQDGASPNNGVQDLLFSNAGTGLYKFPAGTTVGSTLVSAATLSTGGTYTRSFTITLSAANEVTIKDELYPGPVASGIPLSTMLRTTSGGTTYTNYSNQYDGLSIGIANKGTSLNPTMDIGKITITKYTQADLPALYNIQLNGYTNNTFSGAARIGNPGDLWNNPDWVGVYSGSTNLFTGVSLLTSSGTSLGVTVSMTATYDNNTTDWNTGVFNHYSGQTAGSATPVLMDQVVKVDYSGSVNVLTIKFSGLPANKLVTAYFYGAGNGGGQGGQWSLNGGTAIKIAYDGSPTGRDVTLNSSKGISWDILAGASDGSGDLIITATGPAGGNPWWQTYMNGLQLQVGGTAPTILGLANQTVEDGTTVVLNPVVTGNPAPTYQWYENGTIMLGETTPSLTLTSVTTGQNGNVYSLVAENAIGVASNSMTLTVNASVYSTMTVTSVSPTNGAAGICYDTPLTVSFSEPMSLGTIGAIKVYDAANPGTPVDTINAAAGLGQQRTFPGDGQSFTYPTITISGNTVKIAPHFNTLTSNKTYYVTIDPKTFKDSGGTNFVGLTDTNLWQFTTKPTGPADPANIVVNSDGSADFVTVQGAVNSIPAGANATQRVINIRDGLYKEIVNITGKHNVTFNGQSRQGTVISFPNNATYQVANGGTTHARMNFKVNANDVIINSLTISNSTPQGGSQAEALMIEGNNAATAAKRCIINNSDIVSRQDTILGNINASQAYFYNSLIKGNFDYIWGGGNLFFEQCEIRTIAGASSFNVTAARTDTGATQSSSLPWANPGGTYTANGVSFVNCTFTAEPGVGAVTLAGSNGTAGNNVSWYGCDFATNYIAPSASLFSGNFVFWQAANTMTNDPVTFAVLTSLSGADTRLQAATNVVTWFYGWTPVLPATTPNSPVISAPTVLPDGNFQLSATGDNGANYRVWASDDVTLTPIISTWTQIGSGTFGTGPEIITDLDATNHLQRFYLLTVP